MGYDLPGAVAQPDIKRGHDYWVVIERLADMKAITMAAGALGAML